MPKEPFIVDVHCHIFPSREVALAALRGRLSTEYDGTVPELARYMKDVSVSKAVMVNWTPIADMRESARARLSGDLAPAKRSEAEAQIEATLIDRLKRRNRWTCEAAKGNPHLVPFIGIDPVLAPEEMRDELVGLVEKHGARGVKLHPDLQRFYPNDRRFWPFYKAAEALGVPLFYHTGIIGEGKEYYSHPKYFAELLSNFPSLKVGLAHIFVGYWNEMPRIKWIVEHFPQVFFDCSGILGEGNPRMATSDEQFMEICRSVGVERILYGSDHPVFDARTDLRRLQRLPFKQEERNLILGQNARRVYNL